MPTKTIEAPNRAAAIFEQLKADDEQARTRALHEQAQAQAESEAREAARLAGLDEIRARVKAQLSGTDLEAAREKLHAALDEFVSVNHAYEQRVRDVFESATSDPALSPLPANWANSGHGLYRPQVDGERLPVARPMTDIRDAAIAAIRKHYPRTIINLEFPPE
jgi:DNA-binding transcriptional regulator YiaG